jgi:hypothetical protein
MYSSQNSIPFPARFQTGKMASFKKDRNDNNNLKGSVDVPVPVPVPDNNGVTEAVSMAEYEEHQLDDDMDEDEVVKERTTLIHWDPVCCCHQYLNKKRAHVSHFSQGSIQTSLRIFYLNNFHHKKVCSRECARMTFLLATLFRFKER